MMVCSLGMGDTNNTPPGSLTAASIFKKNSSASLFFFFFFSLIPLAHMLPQFNYIVAQAGADAHLPPVPPSGLPRFSQYSGSPSIAAALTNSEQHQLQQAPLQYRPAAQVAPAPPAFERREHQQRPYHARLSPPPVRSTAAAAAAAAATLPRPTHTHTVLPPPSSQLSYLPSSNTHAPNTAPLSSSSSSSFRPFPPTWREFEHPPLPQVPRASIWHTPLAPPAPATASAPPQPSQPSIPVIDPDSYEYDPYQPQWDQGKERKRGVFWFQNALMCIDGLFHLVKKKRRMQNKGKRCKCYAIAMIC
ncbi:hypothetical protein BX666DRAFT_556340 [Dichotomocladium elegans]|nr:hypothetical protein BX666DRAFT_556340 [Dichotomocladium elegans]